MLATLPDVDTFLRLSWDEIQPFYDELAGRALNADTVDSFLADWTALDSRVHDTYVRRHLDAAGNTADAEAERAFHAFLANIFPRALEQEQRLKEKLLASGVTPHDFEIPLRNMRAQAELFREDNVPLLAKERELTTEYDKIIGAQTVEWEGKEIPIQQLAPIYQDPEREVRERAWRLAAERQLADRDQINELWRRFLEARLQIARNAGLPSYRDYRWRELLRFDYTPSDARRFHDAIEKVVVPAAERIHARRKQRLGVDSLRPWDLIVDPLGRPPLRPYHSAEELEERSADIFHHVDPVLGGYFQKMRDAKLLDLENRKNKAPGGFCTHFNVDRRPFIFMNAVGLHNDVTVILHESGHAFHVFETRDLPYAQQWEVGMEFAEVASMSMELLAAPYLARDQGGFYEEGDAARARVQHLESILLIWPRLAAFDKFQHWIYENPDAATDPQKLDQHWLDLLERFGSGVDWTGLETYRKSSWHSILHIFEVPFYMIEYGLAQLGAVQIWANALRDQKSAVERYRQALALGGTRPIPDLYAAAGAQLAFDEATLRAAVNLIEEKLTELDAAV